MTTYVFKKGEFKPEFKKFLTRLNDDDMKIFVVNVFCSGHPSKFLKITNKNTFCCFRDYFLHVNKILLNKIYPKLIENKENLYFFNRMDRFKNYEKKHYIDILLLIIEYEYDTLIFDIITYFDKEDAKHFYEYVWKYINDCYLNIYDSSELNLIENKHLNSRFLKIVQPIIYKNYYINKCDTNTVLKKNMKMIGYFGDEYICDEVLITHHKKYNSIIKSNLFGKKVYIQYNKYFRSGELKLYLSESKIDERQLKEFPLSCVLPNYYEMIHKETLNVLMVVINTLKIKMDLNLLKEIVYKYI